MTSDTDRYLFLGMGDLARETIHIAIGRADEDGSSFDVAYFVEPGFDVPEDAANLCRSTEEALDRYPPDQWLAVCCVGTPPDRKRLFDQFKSLGYDFVADFWLDATVLDAELGEGTIVFPGARIAEGARIGRNVLVNFNAVVGHDAEIGDHSVISPGVNLGGRIVGGEGVQYGIGSSMLQGMKAGDFSVLAAGSSAWTDIPAGATAIGVPARVRAIPGRKKSGEEA